MLRLRLRVALAVLSLIGLGSASHLVAQGGTIRGRVVDSVRAPLARATVTVDGTGFRATSNDQGRYEIGSVPAGAYTVRARLLGYVPATARVTVATGRVAEQHFTLRSEPIGVAGVQVTGSRARHTAAEELAVPVDIFPMQEIRAQGTTETAQILAQIAPSVNFPRQSIADASDIVRPFTMRGLGPDHTLVLVNGKRRHRMALVHYFGAALGAGSSGVDMNALPDNAIARLDVLRDGAAAQYGSDAIAGVVNVVLQEGESTPTLGASWGRHVTADYPDDGTTYNVAGSWGLRLGSGSLALFGTYRQRGATSRACPEAADMIVTGDADQVVDCRIVSKNNPVPQPNYHWGDGFARDYIGFANATLPLNPDRTTALYAFGGYSFREGTGNGYFRYPPETKNWAEIYPLGFLPEFNPDVADYSAVGGLRGAAGGWRYDVSGSVAANDFEFHLRNTLNTSLGPCLETACAPGPDRTFGTGDDPRIPNQTAFFAGELKLGEQIASVDVARSVALGGLPGPLNLALGVAFRRETYKIVQGERASWIDGGHLARDSTPALAGSQVFPGLRPSDEADADRTNFAVYAEGETNLSSALLANAAARFESYSDFGEQVTGKLALRLQPSPRWTFRASASTGFRAPSLSQSHYSQTVTNFQGGVAFQVGIFPVGSAAAGALGAQPLEPETSFNLGGGFAFSPIPEFTVTADGYWVEVDGRILMTAELDDDSLRARMARAGAPNVSRARYFTNALDTRTRGLDITGSYVRDLGNERSVSFDLAVNLTRTRVIDSTPLPPELQNTASPVARFDTLLEGGLNAIERERPEWRGTLTTRYTAGAWTGLVRGAYYGKFYSTLVNYSQVDEYASKVLFDVELSRTFPNGIGLAVGARNVFDTYPDQAPSSNSFDVLIYPTASPFGFNGRFVYARLEATLGR